MTFNYVLDETTFISGGPINNGGNVLKWLFKTFLNNATPSEKDYNDFFKNIETIPAGCDGLLFLPYLYGERAPVWDEKASGVFFGIKSFHTNAHFLTQVAAKPSSNVKINFFFLIKRLYSDFACGRVLIKKSITSIKPLFRL